MAFTGDLEQLHIVDIIQLLHTTRKSGAFSVRGARGESRIIFSNGYIVGASHLNNRIRIGTVLLKMNTISREDLDQALEKQKKAGKNRKPLIATLIDLGKIGHEEASRGLKKLIEMTMVELIGWTKGTFTLDSSDICADPECSYPVGTMEQVMSLDAQMVLMDALRVYDERERDRLGGKKVPSYEELFAEEAAADMPGENGGSGNIITADDLGLGDIDHLERRIPQPVIDSEVFDPAEIQRQKIRETLSGFPAEEQEKFVSFLERSSARTARQSPSGRQDGQNRAIILFSGDELITHSVMTICKHEGILVFATEGEEELQGLIGQCLSIKMAPVVVIDSPASPEGMLSQEKMIGMRSRMRERYPFMAVIQLVAPGDYAFTLQSYQDGIRTVLPKPAERSRGAAFISETIQFLETFRTFMNGFFHDAQGTGTDGDRLTGLKKRMAAIRDTTEPAEIAHALLNAVAEVTGRAITFMVRPAELTGERSIGVSGRVSAEGLKIPLTQPSIFSEVVQKGRLFYGESGDDVLRTHLQAEIGAPANPTVILLPLKRRGKVIAVTYGDFGEGPPARVQADILEILADHAGIMVENAVYRKQLAKASHK